MKTLATLCAVSCMLLGCGKSSHTTTAPAASSAAQVRATKPASATHAPTDAQLIDSFVRENYGTWRADRKGWQSDPGADIYSQCGSLRVNTTNGPRYLLAMCGETEAAVQNGMPSMDSEGQTGSVDLYILKPTQDGAGLEAVIQKTDIDSGGKGEPGTVGIERYGPHLFGFHVDDDAMADGYTQSMRSIYLPRGDKFVLAAPRINLDLDNTGSLQCGQTPAECEQRHFDIARDTSSEGDVSSLRITETGSRGERSIHAVYEIKFDAASGQYVIPRALSEGY
jgi:hypothetical protein